MSAIAAGKGRQRERENGGSFRQQTGEELPGLISHARCPALAPSCWRKAERKRTLIDESLPSIIHLCIRSRLNKVEEEGEGAGSGGDGWRRKVGVDGDCCGGGGEGEKFTWTSDGGSIFVFVFFRAPISAQMALKRPPHSLPRLLCVCSSHM